MKGIAGKLSIAFTVLFAGLVLVSARGTLGLGEALIIWAVALIPLYVVLVALLTIVSEMASPRAWCVRRVRRDHSRRS